MYSRRPILASVCWYGLDYLDSGGKVRTFNILKYMHTFTPCIITPKIGAFSSLNAMIVNGRALKSKRFFNGGIFNYLWPDKIWQIKESLKKINPDFVQAEGIWSFPAVYFYCRDFHSPSVLVANNIEYRVAEELYGHGWRTVFLKTIERFCYHRADWLVVCSEEDKLKIIRDFSMPEEKILIVPNGVEVRQNNGYEKIKGEKPYLLFMGKLDYRPNREAISFITRKLMPELNNIKCMIIGDGLREKILNENVEYRGRVDNVEEYIAKADICLAPIFSGSGTRIKVLEYLSSAKPLVATSKAVEGLGLEKGKHYLEAEDATQFENAIREILANPEKWNEKARDARAFILSRYAWKKIVLNYEKQLATLL